MHMAVDHQPIRNALRKLASLLAPAAPTRPARVRRFARLQRLEDRCLLSATPVGTEFLVNTVTADNQQTSAQTRQAVAVANNGNFIVAWSSHNQDGNGWGVYAQRYNAAGTPQGPAFQVNTYTQGDQQDAAVAVDGAGNFVITWQSHGQDGGGWGVYAQRYNATGAAQGSEFRVNTTTAGDQINPSVAMDGGGGFVIAWQSQGQDGSGWGVYAQRYNAAGAAAGRRVPRQHHHRRRPDQSGRGHGRGRRLRRHLAE